MLVVDKRLSTFAHQRAHDARAQIGNFFVRVVDRRHYLLQVASAFVAEEVQKQLNHLIRAHNFQFVGIFDVHHLIADVVGSLHHIHQRMAGISLVANLQYLQFAGNLAKDVFFGGEETKFAFLRGVQRRERIFHNRHEHAVGHGKTALPATFELVHQPSEAVGVAFEVGEVGPLRRSEQRLQFLSGTFGEIGGNGFFAAVPERRVAQVVSQTGCSHYRVDVVEFVHPRLIGIFFAQLQGNFACQRTAHARHFEAVSQTVVHKYASRQGKHLRLVLQSAERRRKHQAVVVALEVAAYS